MQKDLKHTNYSEKELKNQQFIQQTFSYENYIDTYKIHKHNIITRNRSEEEKNCIGL